MTARLFYRGWTACPGRALRPTRVIIDSMSRATVGCRQRPPEYGRVLRFVVPALGFPSATVDYRRGGAGGRVIEVSVRQDVRLSIDSVTAFSLAPLRFATYMGLGRNLRARPVASPPPAPAPPVRSSPAGPDRRHRGRDGWRCSCSRWASSGNTSADRMPRPRPGRPITSPTTRWRTSSDYGRPPCRVIDFVRCRNVLGSAEIFRCAEEVRVPASRETRRG